METVSLDVAHFAHWLAQQPPDETYLYAGENCAVVQYLNAHGFHGVHAGFATATGFRSDGVLIEIDLGDKVARALSEVGRKPDQRDFGQSTWDATTKAIKALLPIARGEGR